MAPREIVIVCTQCDKLSNGDTTGAWGEEIAAPYYIFKNAGYKVWLASPNGGPIPIDDHSLQGDFKTEDTVKFLEKDGAETEEAQKQLKNSAKISEIDPNKVDGIFAAGGHGAAIDFPHNTVLANLVSKLYAAGKLVSSVCHGAEIFVSAVDDKGQPIAKNKRAKDAPLVSATLKKIDWLLQKVTGFSEAEEQIIRKQRNINIKSPEAYLRDVGGVFAKAQEDWGPHVEVDTSGTGPIVTGQNPGSSAATADAIVKLLSGQA